MTRDRPDIVVIGAGAAGLAAARTALSLGLTVEVLEARDRIGGRAFTDDLVPGVPWDRGAHWLHDAPRNFFAAFAARRDFAFDRTPSRSYLWGPDGWAGEDVQQERDAYFARAFAAIKGAGKSGLDVAASEVVPPHPRFRAMFDSWFAAVSGTEPDRTSTLDNFRYRRTGVNRGVRPGYGALVAEYGWGLPVRLSTPVACVRWDGTDVIVETARGTLGCRAAIVTASTSALAGGALSFHPPLPAETLDALESVPLGEAEKVALAFDRDVFGLPGNSRLHFEHGTHEAIRFHIRPCGHNVAIGHVAGRFASELLAQGPRAMAAFAEEKLVEVFGRGVRQARVATAATDWKGDPYIRGGYSCALPGAADRRMVLREPVGDRVFLAGEACSLTAYGTVHGAHGSGVEAARRAAAALGAGAPAPMAADSADSIAGETA